MSIINKGTSFANGEQLTADKINDLIDLATFNQDATDSQTTDVNSAGQIVVNQGGIDTAQLATGAIATSNIEDSTSKTDGVTLPKIQHIDTAKVLGRTTAGEGNVEEVDFKTETDMVSDSDTAVASQKSIKAYVDTTVAATRSFSKPDFIGTFAAIPASDTDVTITHSLGTTDLIYFIQMKLPSGAITQMNPALTYPYSNNTKPAGLSVFIETNTFSCRSGYGWAWWREQGEGTGNSASNISADSDRTNYQFRIIAYKLS